MFSALLKEKKGKIKQKIFSLSIKNFLLASYAYKTNKKR
tara:strand:+ start:552 stop:668 length:117 start_codon:yes stop_codon:yes gene_type:complete